MKRVLLIATVQSHIGQFHKPLMKLLKESGWEIHVAARNNLAEKNGLQLDYPDKVFDIPFQRSPFDSGNLRAYKMLKDLLKKEHYDVIHCNTPVGGILGRLAGCKYRARGTKIYYTAHGFHFYKGAPVKNWVIYYPIELWASRFTDKLITITNEDYNLAKRKFHCPVYHIHGVGANSAKYYPISKSDQREIKDKLGIEGQIIINVGELLPNKNQKTAIMAMRQIIKKNPQAKLLIAGNGHEKEKLKQLVKWFHLEDYVQFLGYTTKLQEYIQIADVEIACSYREGLPLNIMEAMLCGKSIVASHNRGHDELIINGETGYLVDPDDICGFANMVCNVLDNPDKLSERVLNRVEKYKDTYVKEELKMIYYS